MDPQQQWKHAQMDRIGGYVAASGIHPRAGDVIMGLARQERYEMAADIAYNHGDPKLAAQLLGEAKDYHTAWRYAQEAGGEALAREYQAQFHEQRRMQQCPSAEAGPAERYEHRIRELGGDDPAEMQRMLDAGDYARLHAIYRAAQQLYALRDDLATAQAMHVYAERMEQLMSGSADKNVADK